MDKEGEEFEGDAIIRVGSGYKGFMGEKRRRTKEINEKNRRKRRGKHTSDYSNALNYLTARYTIRVR